MTFEDLRSLALGHQPSRLLLTALDLGLFDLLAGRAQTAAEVAAALGLDLRATEIVLNALVALGVLEVAGGRFTDAEPARRFLAATSPEYRGDILLHIRGGWEDWEGLERAWRTGKPALQRKTQQLPSTAEGLRHFILGMENMTRELAPLLAERLPLAGCRKALDLGSGPGNYALAFARRWPELRVVHYDLPVTSAVARDFLSGRPGAERVEFREGDFLVDSLGSGYDFVWASQILHMLGEADGAALLARVAQALVPGGAVGAHDQFLEPDKTSPRAAAVFGVHMLVATEGGRTYRLDVVDGWGRAAGLEREGVIDYGGPSRVLLLRKPRV